MIYDKQPIDFHTQIDFLKEKGMFFSDEYHAIKSLYSISYFRLASYWRHFEQNESISSKKKVGFEDVLRLYSFDQKLRNIVFASIQCIEIAVRTRVSHFLSMKYDAFWFLDSTLFKTQAIHKTCVEKIKEEIGRSHEDFIKDHKDRYDVPNIPPSWKTMEVTSFGTLSKLYSNIADNEIKKVISRSFNLPSYLFLENWMKCAAVLRNCCAHHARLWNRRFSTIPKIPTKLPGEWIITPLRRPEKLYGQLCCLVYLEDSIYPNSGLRYNICRLLAEYPEIEINAMGFQQDWMNQSLWNINL